MPDLGEIATTSGLPLRRLRHVLDHDVLPGGSTRGLGRGTARVFEPFEVFGLVLATVLLEAGLRRATVRDCLAALVEGVTAANVTEIPLYRAFSTSGPSRLEVGDGSQIRLAIPGRSRAPVPMPDWTPLGGSPRSSAAFEPLVTIAIDLARVRRMAGRVS